MIPEPSDAISNTLSLSKPPQTHQQLKTLSSNSGSSSLSP